MRILFDDLIKEEDRENLPEDAISVNITDLNYINAILGAKTNPVVGKKSIAKKLAKLTFNLLKNREKDYEIKVTMIDEVATELDVYEYYTKELDKLMRVGNK